MRLRTVAKIVLTDIYNFIWSLKAYPPDMYRKNCEPRLDRHKIWHFFTSAAQFWIYCLKNSIDDPDLTFQLNYWEGFIGEF